MYSISNHPVNHNISTNVMANELNNYAKVNSLNGPDVYAKIGGFKNLKKKTKKRKKTKKNKRSNRYKNSIKKYKLRGGSGDKFIISTYNILARGNTHYNWRSHRNIPDTPKGGDKQLFDFNRNDTIKQWKKAIKKNTRLETEEQTNNRYTLVADDIIESESDIVCLQECDPAFFDPKYNKNANALLDLYERKDQLEAIRPEKKSGGGPSILFKKINNFKQVWDDKVIFTKYDEFGGSSKGAVILPVLDKKNNSIWVVSGHFAGEGKHRGKLVSEIERLTELTSHPSSGEDTSIIVMGDFNIEGVGAITAGRQDLMSYEYKASEDYDGTALSPWSRIKESERIDSTWYNKESHFTIKEMTGLNGEFTEEKNLDHVFVTKMDDRFKKIDKTITGDRGFIYGPYKEDSKFIMKIGGNVYNSKLKLKDITKFRKRTRNKGPAQIGRGSDHKMIIVSFDPK